MSITVTVAHRASLMSDDELLQEYDWEARERPVNEHEEYKQRYVLARYHAELIRRNLQWS